MKKQYIEPSAAVFIFQSVHMVAESSTGITDDSDPATSLSEDRREELGGGDNDARGGFGNNQSIWDNAW